MPPKIDVTLILPAYNEVKSIGRTIQEARDYFKKAGKNCEIIVAADGTDGTRELVTKMAKTDNLLKVLGDSQRMGKGRGVRLAAQMAQGEIIGFSDADNKTPIEEFGKLEAPLRSGYEVAIGSRKLQASHVEREQKWYRRVGSEGFAVLRRLIIGLGDIADTQCGFKFFQRKAALDLFSQQKIDRGIFDVELLYHARRSGYRIAEVPIRWRDDGDSRMAVVRDNLRNLFDLVRIRLGI